MSEFGKADGPECHPFNRLPELLTQEICFWTGRGSRPAFLKERLPKCGRDVASEKASSPAQCLRKMGGKENGKLEEAPSNIERPWEGFFS